MISATKRIAENGRCYALGVELVSLSHWSLNMTSPQNNDSIYRLTSHPAGPPSVTFADRKTFLFFIIDGLIELRPAIDSQLLYLALI